MTLRQSLLPPNHPGVPDSAPQPVLAEPESAPRSPARPASESAEAGGASPLPRTLAQLPGPQSTSQAVSLSNEDLGRSLNPTEAQIRTKSKFWASLADHPLIGGKAPSLALIKQVTQSAAIEGWWRKPGFKEWFLNERASDERLDWLLHLSMSALEDILLSTDPKSQGARVAAIKTVAEMAGKLKGVGTGKGPDERRQAAIDSMSKADLTKLLESQGIRVDHHVVSLDADHVKKETP